MKKWKSTAAIAASIILCTIFAAVLLIYTKPIENRVFDLSLNWEGEAIPDDWVYDQKGWTVFTQKDKAAVILTPDGTGGFQGLDYPGQTIYFSRLLTEEVDSPTLRLNAGNYSISVFLDNVLIYTDCPEQNNQIGCLELPMLEWFREEPVTITLPQNYQGKTLTVAQSTDPIPEKEDGTVWLCAVTLYSSYAYESDLIAESFQTAIPASLAFAAGILLLFLFILQIFRGTPDIETICGALLSFFWMTGKLAQTSFSGYYFSLLPIDAISLYQDFSLLLLLIFLAAHLTKRKYILPWVFIAAQTILILISLILQNTKGYNLQIIPKLSLIGIAALLLFLFCGFQEWKRGNWFYRCFCLLTISGIFLWGIIIILSLLTKHPFAANLWQQLTIGAFGYFLWMLTLLMTITALAAAIAEAIQKEILHRMEANLFAQRMELTQSSYEAMRQQHEQIMILRHDMAKHFQLLRQMTKETQTAEYLDNLMGQNKKIRPVIQSGNEILDIILNSKLSTAADAGIQTELIRTQAPDKLPFPDVQLCSLIMNLMDNACEAASAPNLDRRYIKLDLHIKNNFFVFICENAATSDWMQKETTFGHGFGLKIIQQIAKQHDTLINTECGKDFYKVTVLIPLL